MGCDEFAQISDPFYNYLMLYASSKTNVLKTSHMQADGGDPLLVDGRRLVFHGSPHQRVERFDEAAVGTGEGVHAFGWGFYFTDTLDVADNYRQVLGGAAAKLCGACFRPDPELWVAGQYYAGIVIDDVREGLEILEYRGNVEAILESAWWRLEVEKAVGGQLYECFIPSDEHFLLWDETLGNQSVAVQQALGRLHFELRARVARPSDVTGDQPSGSVIYNVMQEYFAEGRRNDVFENKGNFGQKEASMELHDVGVKGIKYLDAESRFTDVHSYNYVVFSSADIEVVGAGDQVSIQGDPGSEESYARERQR